MLDWCQQVLQEERRESGTAAQAGLRVDRSCLRADLPASIRDVDTPDAARPEESGRHCHPYSDWPMDLPRSHDPTYGFASAFRVALDGQQPFVYLIAKRGRPWASKNAPAGARNVGGITVGGLTSSPQGMSMSSSSRKVTTPPRSTRVMK